MKFRGNARLDELFHKQKALVRVYKTRIDCEGEKNTTLQASDRPGNRRPD